EGFGASLEAGRTASLVTRDIHRDQPVVVTSGMTLIFSSATLKVTEAEFQAAMESAIAPLRGDARISGLTTPYSVPASEQATFISRDGHKALVIVQFNDQAGTMLLARFTDVSQYATNIVSLIGLAVAIDYSLFVVNRFRDELAAGATREEAIAIAMSTAGRAITFSGVTVAIGLSAMLFYQGTFMASMGAAGGIVVAIAVIYGLTFLPAALAILGQCRGLVASMGETAG